eukprot:99970-Chlamydomonas_euryale.AAC.1
MRNSRGKRILAQGEGEGWRAVAGMTAQAWMTIMRVAQVRQSGRPGICRCTAWSRGWKLCILYIYIGGLGGIGSGPSLLGLHRHWIRINPLLLRRHWMGNKPLGAAQALDQDQSFGAAQALDGDQAFGGCAGGLATFCFGHMTPWRVLARHTKVLGVAVASELK